MSVPAVDPAMNPGLHPGLYPGLKPLSTRRKPPSWLTLRMRPVATGCQGSRITRFRSCLLLDGSLLVTCPILSCARKTVDGRIGYRDGALVSRWDLSCTPAGQYGRIDRQRTFVRWQIRWSAVYSPLRSPTGLPSEARTFIGGLFAPAPALFL